MDSRSLFLTANTESIYAVAWLNLKDGPVVVESPPNTLGLVDDFWFHYVTDLGNAGPDKGKGGKFLFLPPDYQGRGAGGLSRLQIADLRQPVRHARLSGERRPEARRRQHQAAPAHLSAGAGRQSARDQLRQRLGQGFNTIHAMDFSYFEEVNEVVQEEPSAAIDPETLGLLASIGIEKGKPFAPDARMKAILTEAAAVGNATARTLAYRSRIPEARLYPEQRVGNARSSAAATNSCSDGARLLDARSFFFFYATGITPAMSMKMVGVGSQYAAAFVDSKSQPLDGGKTYRLHLPPNIPAKDFWSLVLYDNQTRSMLQTDQQFPSIGSQKKGVVVNPDTSVDVYFGPKAPAGKESNWVQTVARQGLERDPAALRSAAAIVRQDLEAGRDRGSELKRSTP